MFILGNTQSSERNDKAIRKNENVFNINIKTSEGGVGKTNVLFPPPNSLLTVIM